MFSSAVVGSPSRRLIIGRRRRVVRGDRRRVRDRLPFEQHALAVARRTAADIAPAARRVNRIKYIDSKRHRPGRVWQRAQIEDPLLQISSVRLGIL